MKNLIAIFAFCFSVGKCFSQVGEWVWIHGDSIPSTAIYGTLGVPSPANHPFPLYEACEWTDLNGNFWLFGGMQNNGNFHNDLWKYNPLTNEWTWMKGPGYSFPNDSGSYGIQGIPSPLNNPPARGFGAASWVDLQGNLWMFGGAISYFPSYNGAFSDLWKYNISTNEWTWMKGWDGVNHPSFYVAQGTFSLANDPGSRSEMAATWTDSTGNLWFFGGFNVIGFFNDLWQYDITINQWAWMKGSQFLGQQGAYGTLGVENPTNTPGARTSYCRWKDNADNLWLFGGSNTTSFNDLWRFNLSTNNWTWMRGDSTMNGTYGIKCNGSSANIPGARFEHRASWTDQFGNFWFFGGNDHMFSSTGVWNDLWMYCVSTSQWIWVSGDSILNPTGIWGTKGVSSSSNKPNGRMGAVAWTDNNGHLFFFGGNAGLIYNDLWKYTIDTTCGSCPTSTSIQKNNPPKANELTISPNPANSSLIISFPFSEKELIEIHLYNPLGSQVYFSKEKITAGKFSKQINVENLGNGIYFLEVKTKEGVLNKKVVVQH